MDEPDPSTKALLDNIAKSERYADDLAGFATDLRNVGHEDAADRLLRFSRQYRICALDLRGKLAALAHVDPDP